MADRKLVRPSLGNIKERPPARGPARRKQVPAEQTNAENFYYIKQMQSKTAMVFVLLDGTELRGWIEWYDKNTIKLHRKKAPNLLIFKHSIKFMFKEEELRTRGGRRRARQS